VRGAEESRARELLAMTCDQIADAQPQKGDEWGYGLPLPDGSR
jgi:hypothetical protein